MVRGLAGFALSLLLLTSASDLVAQSETDQVVRFYQARVAADPDDSFNYQKLGAAYVQKARESGDVTYYALAETALRRALDLVGDAPAAAAPTTHLAAVYLARHRFRDALASAERALRLRPDALAPYAIVGDAQVELGEYDQASLAYSRMLGLTGPRHPHSRLAYLRFLRGDVRGAIDQMKRAVDATVESSAPRENVAWAEVQLGDLYFQSGDLAGSDRGYREALARYPGYHRALAGLGRVRAAEGRYRDAADLYVRALAVIPLPEYAAALGDVYAKQGRAAEARKQYDLVEYIGRLNAINEVIYNRELALFYADHDLKPKAALELAARELDVRGDVYTHDVLAWALYRTGRAREALTAMTEALKLGTRDARLFFHAGMIHAALGDADRARDYLARALATNPHFHLLHADVARETLARLGTRPGHP